METVEVIPNLHRLRVGNWQLYLWHDQDSLVLIDTGTPGGGDGVRKAIESLGFDPTALTGIVLTHFHVDHAGALAEIEQWSDAPVFAHARDASIIRGEVPPPPPVLADWERPIFEQVSAGTPEVAPPARVDRELTGGEVLEFGGGARVLSIPGHTDGSIALHLPGHGVLFTGDTAAHMEGQVMLGIFNLDRSRAAESFRRLAELDVETACFGHGEPITSGAGTRLREVAAGLA
ncbi:MBL fold metallo-hydrolase [Amycolatopsis rhizosphaerae]|uniref:MBL fold metallo-hydrolase n=1 Tax=Amycolatopsis rhizosphaerae TaxID=2053003 RepID=A0A558AIR6_9PSEU|nr:MBL fold metallo-hydrolase [Amycolatopsis rhizosphaerae]TVT24157.1 MBL fold metallo-hydrolase [Amycolatopsis rhizosphaerae]